MHNALFKRRLVRSEAGEMRPEKQSHFHLAQTDIVKERMRAAVTER